MISACLNQGKYGIHHPLVKPSSHLDSGNLDPNVTPLPKQCSEGQRAMGSWEAAEPGAPAGTQEGATSLRNRPCYRPLGTLRHPNEESQRPPFTQNINGFNEDATFCKQIISFVHEEINRILSNKSVIFLGFRFMTSGSFNV